MRRALFLAEVQQRGEWSRRLAVRGAVGAARPSLSPRTCGHRASGLRAVRPRRLADDGSAGGAVALLEAEEVLVVSENLDHRLILIQFHLQMDLHQLL